MRIKLLRAAWFGLWLLRSSPIEGGNVTAVEVPTMMRQPTISSDARRIAFVANGDLFLGNAHGGRATRIVDDPVYASHPRFAPSGKQIAFTSLRSGNGDVYLVDLDTLAQRRLTYHHAGDAVESWSSDGKFVYFSSSRSDIGGYADIFAVPVRGGTPFSVSRSRFEGEYNASISPDGKWLAFNSNDRVRQWYRMGPRSDDATDIWIKPTDPALDRFEKITTFEGKDSWPMWAPEGKGLYFVTDEYSQNGAENIIYQSLSGVRRPITSFETGRVSWPTIAGNSTIAFERDFAIWTVGDGGAPRRVDFTLSAEEIDEETIRDETVSRVSEFHVAKGSRHAAIVIHGDVFLYDLDTRELVRLTETPQPEQDARLSPSGREIAYVALRDGYFDIFVYDLVAERETRLTATPETERQLRFSPDGLRVAFVEGADRLKSVDINGEMPIEIATGLMIDPEFAWSPDSRLLAYVAADANWLSNLWIVQAEAPRSRVQLTDFPDVYFNGLSWTEDGRTLFLSTWTTRETRQVARVHLADWVFNSSLEEWNNAGLYARVDYILPANESLVLEAVSRDESIALFSGTSLGRSGLWRSAIAAGGLDDFSLVAPGRISAATILDDGSIIYLSNGDLYQTDAEGRGPERIGLSADFGGTPATKRLALFREAWLVIRDWFGDETFNGKNWEALYTNYEPFVRGARNGFDFMTVVRLMLGELNASHTSVWGDPSIEGETVGDLGVDFDGAELQWGRLVVASIVSTAAGEDALLQMGDVVVAMNGTELSAGVNLHQLLVGQVGETVSLAVNRDGQIVELAVGAHSSGDVAEQRYRAWVTYNETLVERLSGGRFTYVHRRHFGSGATEELRRQLGASALSKQGVVLDVRYNGGGIESTLAIGYLRRRAVHFNAFKDKVVAPGALVHGIPLLDRPIVLVQNEQVLSDTESLSHQFRTLGVGPVVGTRTSGWNMGQRGFRLFDGTRVSVGSWKALTSDGEDMDRSGREPDVYMDRSLEETLKGIDSQLESAVAALDEWIGKLERSDR